MAANELDLELRLGPYRPPVAFIARAPPALPAPAPLVWPRTLRRPSRPKPELLITKFLNLRLMGLYHMVPANLRSEIRELNANNFFALLNHNAMTDGFYFCRNNVARPPAPWIKREGPRKVYTDDNRVLIGRFVTYSYGETQVKVTRYTSILQEGPNIALYRIRGRHGNWF